MCGPYILTFVCRICALLDELLFTLQFVDFLSLSRHLVTFNRIRLGTVHMRIHALECADMFNRIRLGTV